MKIIVVTAQVPFMTGGAEIMSRGLTDALRSAGHEAEIVSYPFRFGPPAAVRESMKAWKEMDFAHFDCGSIDELIALKFPAYFASHSSKRVWLTHQHRSVYELFDTPFGEQSSDSDALELRDEIVAKDTSCLSAAKSVFTISKTVSDRLLKYNNVKSSPLYQPPFGESEYQEGDSYSYVFVPSRLEPLKRQELIIRALVHVRSRVTAVIAGEGGNRGALMRLVQALGVENRIRFLGRIDHRTMLQYYKHSLAVFFAPYMEDYGLITLEAMLSAKPVITCVDSGGPTEFVRHEETGYILDPDPELIAGRIDALCSDRAKAREIGHNGRSLYGLMKISWQNVVENLLE